MAERWSICTIRHGETDYNKQGRYAGTIDIPLNEAGRSDARLALANIRKVPLDLCISSPFIRAMETAEILTEGRVEIVPIPYARERNFGILQGMVSGDVETLRPPIHFIKVGGDYHSLDPPGAESFTDLHNRAGKLWRFILTKHQGKRILVVSHGVFLQQFHGIIRGLNWIDSLGEHVGNLELTTFEMDGERPISESRAHLMNREQNDF